MAILHTLSLTSGLGLAVAVRMESSSETLAIQAVDLWTVKTWSQLPRRRNSFLDALLWRQSLRWRLKTSAECLQMASPGSQVWWLLQIFHLLAKVWLLCGFETTPGLTHVLQSRKQHLQNPEGRQDMELGRNGEPEKCKAELCHMAESSQWKAKNSWLSWAKKEETLASYIA